MHRTSTAFPPTGTPDLYVQPLAEPHHGRPKPRHTGFREIQTHQCSRWFDFHGAKRPALWEWPSTRMGAWTPVVLAKRRARSGHSFQYRSTEINRPGSRMALRSDVPPAGGTRSLGPKSHSANPARRAISNCPSRDKSRWMGIWEAAFSQAWARRLDDRLHGAIRSSRTSPWVTRPTGPSSRRRSRRSNALASWLPAMGMNSQPAAVSCLSNGCGQASAPRSSNAGWCASYNRH